MESLFKRVMPWLGEENGFSLKDPQAQNGGVPGLSLVQWMNMQNSANSGSGVQPVVQNYSSPDVSKQMNLQSHIHQTNAMSIPPQINHQNQNQIMIQSSQLQQQQPQVQQHQQQRMLQQSPQQQQQHQHLLLLQQQQQLQGRIPAQLTEQQMHLQLLHKLQQQHMLGQLPFHAQEQQKAEPPSLDQALLPHLPNLQPLPATLHQAAGKNPQLAAPMNKCQQSPADLVALAAIPLPSGFLTSRGTQSVLTEDVPSCSTSPSTNNCPALPPAGISGKMQQQQQNDVTMTSSASFSDVKPLISAAPKMLQQQASISATGSLQNQAAFAPHPQQGLYMSHAAPPHIDYLDAHIQTEAQLPQNFPVASTSFDQPHQQQQPIFFRDGEMQTSASDLRNNVLFGVNIESPLGIPISGEQLLARSLDSGRDIPNHHHLHPNGMDASFGGSKDTQAELSSSMVSQSFGITDMGLNSIESAVHDGSSLLNKCSWPTQPQLQRMRTYTKVLLNFTHCLLLSLVRDVFKLWILNWTGL